MASQINIKVRTDDLITTSTNFSNEIKKIENEWKLISDQVNKMSGYWIGDASDTHQQHYNSVKEEVEELLAKLKERPDELLRMADLYDQVEREAVESVMALSDNVII